MLRHHKGKPKLMKWNVVLQFCQVLSLQTTNWKLKFRCGENDILKYGW